MSGRALPAAILDVDGTLVDTNYHHAVAWFRAFRDHGVVLPLWRIHRYIGMGSDQLVPSLAGEDFDRDRGDDLRADETEHYQALIDEVELLDGARELVLELRERGHKVVLASSAKPHELDHYLDLLDARPIVHAWPSSGDVEHTKPQPDLVNAAIEKAGGGPAVMVGDSIWDCRAAAAADTPVLGVLTGGFSREELREAGAVDVVDSLAEVRGRLDQPPLA